MIQFYFKTILLHSPTGVQTGNLHSALNSKCKLLSIPPPNQLVHSANYSINNSIINSTSLHRDLGVLVSNNLTWDEHYSAIISRAYKSLYFIRRATSNSHSPSTKLSLYKSLIRPKLSYCSQLWRPYKIKDIKLFERVQRRATKFILKDYHSDYKIQCLRATLQSPPKLSLRLK